MACTQISCPSCGNGYSGSCCPTCQPAQSIYRGECTDPGTLTTGRFLPVLDYKFCEYRLTSGAGFLVSNINGSGNAGFTWTTTPQVQLSEYQATEDIEFGNLIVMGSDYRWRYLSGPATLGLFMQTDANGMVFFGDPPAATVPDPLVVNDLSVVVAATVADLTVSGDVTLDGVVSGTPVALLGLDANNDVVTQSIASTIAATMFFEAPTSPGGVVPNMTAATGTYLVIGNKLYDSGANLINVTTSQALTVAVAGKYDIDFEGLCIVGANSRAAISLEINGVVVNNGNGLVTGAAGTVATATRSWIPLVGKETRTLAIGDVIKLLLNFDGTCQTYNVRLNALKFADA